MFLSNIGNHDRLTAKKLINSIDQAVKKKLQSILNKSLFMLLLRDGSQACKTGDGKEIFLTWIEGNGMTFCWSFLNVFK